MGEREAPSWRDEVRVLAAGALQDQMTGDGESAAAAVLAISDCYGGGAVMYALMGWCDTVALAHPAMTELGPDDMAHLAWLRDDRPGTILEAGDIPPAGRWAGRVLLARCLMDEPAFTALVNTVPEGRTAEYVLTLLASAAGTLRKIGDGTIARVTGAERGDDHD